MEHFLLNNATQALDTAGVLILAAKRFEAQRRDQAKSKLTAMLFLIALLLPTMPCQLLDPKDDMCHNVRLMDRTHLSNATAALDIVGVYRVKRDERFLELATELSSLDSIAMLCLSAWMLLTTPEH